MIRLFKCANRQNIIVILASPGTDKFYLSLLGWSLAMMHVIDVLLDSFTRLFRHHRYSPRETLFCDSIHCRIESGIGEIGNDLLP